MEAARVKHADPSASVRSRLRWRHKAQRVGAACLAGSMVAMSVPAQEGYLGGPWQATHGVPLSQLWPPSGHVLADFSIAHQDGEPVAIVLWEQRSAPRYSYYYNVGMSWVETQDASRAADGQRVVHVEAYRHGDADRYAAIWQHWIGPRTRLDFGTPLGGWGDHYRTRVDAGYRPLRVDVVGPTDEGDATVLSLWEQRANPAFGVSFGIEEATLQNQIARNAAHGYRPTRIAGYDMDGVARLIVIFERKPGLRTEAVAGLDAAAYQVDFEERVARGMRLSSVAAYTVGGHVRYGGVWDVAAPPLLPAAYPGSGTPIPELQVVEDAMTGFMRERGIRAGALCVVRDGSVVYDRAFGWRDFLLREPLAHTAPFRIASLSKPLTVAAVHALEAAGRLDLTDRVFDLSQSGDGILHIEPFGSADSRLADVTVQHLLDHEGGWDRDVSSDPMFRSLRVADDLGVPMPPSQNDIARWVSGRPLDHAPGTVYAYSNYGYMLLGLVIEAVTGIDATAWIRDAVLDPAGVPGGDFRLGRSLLEHRDTREPWYLVHGGTGSLNVYRPAEGTSDAYGGWDQEALETHGGWTATACAYATFLISYRASGGPRMAGYRYDGSFEGLLPGTRALARDRPDGVSYVAIMNQAYNSAGLDGLPMSDLDAAIDAVATWPSRDVVVRRHVVPLMAAVADDARQGFVRIINRSDNAGSIHIDAWDDAGRQRGPLALVVGPRQAVHFNSNDLELGNADKGLTGAVGTGTGSWRLVLSSALPFDAMAYMRTSDGFLTAMHGLVEPVGQIHEVPIFNPGTNRNQVSELRLTNPHASAVSVTIDGEDDAGSSPGSTVHLSLPGRSSRTLTAAEIEAGDGVSGALGDGHGKWRLSVWSSQRVQVMNLLSSPTGHLTNLSGTPPTNLGAPVHEPARIWLFPSAASDQQGFIRLANRSPDIATVEIAATDDAGRTAGPVEITVGGRQTVHFNSDDLESGNVTKGLSSGIGRGEGSWRLDLRADQPIIALAYIRTGDGFLTAMHDVVRGSGTRHEVSIFNPASNTQQVSRLRLVNPGKVEANVEIAGTDDIGARSDTIGLTVAAQSSRIVTAQELESDDGLSGALGDGVGKWRLSVSSDIAIRVVNLVESPTGHLSNLSSRPMASTATNGEDARLEM